MTDPGKTDAELDDWLTTQFVELVEDLAGSLDIRAGSVEALQVLDYRNLAADLTEHLEVAAGLTAVLSQTCQTCQAVETEDTDSTAGLIRHTATHADSMIEHAKLALSSVDALSRLRFRSDADYTKFRNSIRVALELEQVGHLLANVRHELLESSDGRTAAYSLANQVLHILRVGVTRDRDHDYYLNRDLDGNYRARLTARDCSFDLCQSLLSSSPNCDTSHLLRRLSSLFRAVHSARYGALERSRIRAGQVILRLELGGLDTRLVSLSDLVELHSTLERILSDFIGADLRGASLAGVALVGIRWSATTRWPVGWTERIRAASTEVAFEVFEITDDGGKSTRIVQSSRK